MGGCKTGDGSIAPVGKSFPSADGCNTVSHESWFKSARRIKLIVLFLLVLVHYDGCDLV
jgi:hypothetical protein